MALDQTADDGRVSAANVGISSSTVSENVADGLNIMFTSKKLYVSDVGRQDETATTIVPYSDVGGRTQILT